jgi:hypothetical protein
MAKLALASVVCSASAQGLSPITTELTPVFERTLQLNRDIHSAWGAILTARPNQTALQNSLCFTALAESTTLLTADLFHLITLIYLANKMHDADDTKEVLSLIKDGSVNLQSRIEKDRRSVNQTPNDCPTNSFVAVKAQEVLNLYTSTTSALREIIGRI